MHMMYNSDTFAVVQFDDTSSEGDNWASPRGGFEIVDKFARKEIFINGAVAQSFRDGVEALLETQPTQEDVDDFIGRFTSTAQQPVVMH